MDENRKLIENIQKKWIERKKDQDYWEQFQGIAYEISEGINSEDNHFIYELIQNAEDTKSIENNHVLEFMLENDGLIVYNNEIGFTEDQINAICSFAKSTKAKDKNKGYIGEKGIGFKSVFKITDKPAIFSNGYRFYFNRYDETGITTEYIIPHWINDNELEKYPLQFQNNTHTTIYLPFSKEKRQEQIEKLKRDIKQIEPILLLFLKELYSIKIKEIDKLIINTKKINKKDENLQVTILKNENIANRYYLFKKTINVNQELYEVKSNKGRRKDIKQREIILAFPDFKNKTKDDRVFSFLPTKLHSELNFIIQADFILESGRENIVIDNEWNKWQFEKIEKYIIYDIVDELKKHTKLKYKYLKYFLKNGNSHNELIEELYQNLIYKLEEQNCILTDKETWEKPQNIILLEDKIQLDTKYIKLLFGENYDQVHPKFQLDDFFIREFNIRKVYKEEIIGEICDYFDRYNLNDYDESIVFELTKFLAKNISIDNRALTYEKELFEQVKESLPIIPKYKTNKKFYLYDKIYLSSEYQPDIMIENFVNENEFDFEKYNFLGDEYKEKDNKQLENFIRKIIEEQKEHKNKKTIEFFIKYPDILHRYLKQNIERHYKKVFDFLIANQENNKAEISKILFVLVQNGKFYNSDITIYFFNDSKDDLKILDETLFRLVDKESKYKDFLKDIFKIKEADIINIIISEYLPKIRAIQHKRDAENDKKLLNYTKIIIENFDKFEKEDKEKIKRSIFFISSNQQNKYLKASKIYLTQNISEIIFNDDSIEKYINDKSFFDFLDDSYNQILENIDEKKIIQFFGYFKFEENIKEKDIKDFVRLIKDDLKLNENIEALTLISNSLDEEDNKKIDNIKEFKVYSNKDNLVEIKNLFFEKIDDIDLEFLHQDYKKDRLNNLIQYFQSPYNIEPFIEYLKQNINLEEAIKVYKYLYIRSEFDPNIRRNKSHTITQDKIKLAFKKNKLIFDDKNNRYFPNEVTWKEEKSSSKLFALSTIYPAELEKFFVNKIQVSQTKDIRQIIKQIKDSKERNNDYFALLIDLAELLINENEIDKYKETYDGLFRNPDEAKQFLLKEEKIFILDDNRKNKDDKFFFNDLDITIIADLKPFVFSVYESKYPKNHFNKLVNTLHINRLSSCEIKKEAKDFLREFSINNYREILNFAYDYIFTKYPEDYKNLEDREDDLKEINFIKQVLIYDKIEAKIVINNQEQPLKNKDEQYIIEDNTLKVINEEIIFKIITQKIGFIDELVLEDYYNKVIQGDTDKKDYYDNKKIKEKQNFPLEISDEVVERKEEISKIEDNYDQQYDDFEKNEKEKKDFIEEQSKTAEEVREERQKLKESLAKNQSDGNSKPFINAKNDETIIVDDDKYQENISDENRNSENSFKSATTNYKGQDSKEISKIKDFLYKEYEGHCQICGDTFAYKGKNVFVLKSLNIGENRDVNRKGNTISLCHKHHNIFDKNLQKDTYLEKLPEKINMDIIKEQFIFESFVSKDDINIENDAFYRMDKEDEFVRDVYFLPIKLFGKEEYIKFTEAHIMDFIDVWNNY